MMKTLKILLAGILAAVIVVAIGASVYSAMAAPDVSVPAVQPQVVTVNGNGSTGQGTVSGNGSPGGQGNGNSGNPSTNNGVPQADISGATTVHGTVVSFDLTGLSLTLDDGTALYVQLGSSRYSQSIGFAPQVGEGVTVNGFPGDQGLYSAITVTLDTPDGRGQVYSFRSSTGQPLWAGGGNGKGNGGNR